MLEAGAKLSSLTRVREAPACGGGVGRRKSGPGFRTHTVRPVPVPPGHGPGAQGPAAGTMRVRARPDVTKHLIEGYPVPNTTSTYGRPRVVALS